VPSVGVYAQPLTVTLSKSAASMGRTRDLLDETILTIPLNHAVQAMRQMRAAYMLTVYYTKIAGITSHQRRYGVFVVR
jgi:hypothetical protein